LRRFLDLRLGQQAFAEPQVQAAPRHLAALGLMAVVGVLGCGPVGYMQEVRGRAAEAVAEAKRAGAESAAPYEYTAAVAYLDKAREEGGQAEYQIAISLGKQSQAFALKARAIARRAHTPSLEAAAVDTDKDEAAPAPGKASP
jgi:hypothetical protein